MRGKAPLMARRAGRLSRPGAEVVPAGEAGVGPGAGELVDPAAGGAAAGQPHLRNRAARIDLA
jgi:hypothetical protein